MPLDVEGARKAGATDDQIFEFLRGSVSKRFDVDAALRAGATKQQLIGYLAANYHTLSDDSATSQTPQFPKPDPSILSDPKGWWAAKSDDEKQELLNTAGELVGGTAGAIAGSGVASIPGAAAGAVFGRTSAQLAGKAMGLKPTPKTATQELVETGKTAALAGAGEGVGRAIPAIARVGKTVVKNALKAHIPQESRKVAELAAKQGVPVTAGMVSPAARISQQILERFPTSRGVIEKAKLEQQAPWEANLQRIAAKYGPQRISPEEVGINLRAGLESNLERGQEYFKKLYAPIERQLKNSRVDATPLKSAALELEQQLTPDASSVFPGQLRNQIKQLARYGDEGEIKAAGEVIASTELEDFAQKMTRKSYRNMGAAEREQVEELARRFGINVPEATVPASVQAQLPMDMTFEQAQQLRTSLMEVERKLRQRDPALARQTIPRFRQAIDEAIERSLGSGSPVEQRALQQWRDVNKQYADWASKMFGPAKPGARGNEMADVIRGANNPEHATSRALTYPSAFKQTETAVSPRTVEDLTGSVLPTAEDPAGQLRRYYLDRAIGKARTPTSMGEERMVSPLKLETGLFKEGAEDLTRTVVPGSVDELQESIRVGKAIHPRDINPSGTGHAMEGVREAREVGAAGKLLGGAALGIGGVGGYHYATSGDSGDKALAALGIGAAMLAPRVAAKRLMRPINVNPERLGFQPGGAISGAIGRFTEQALRPPTPAPPPIPEPEDPLNPRRAYGFPR